MENIILKQLGLNKNQILIYEYLLANGAQKASIIAKNTPLQRGVVYKTLDDLIEMGIIEKNEEENAIAHFTPLHPSTLKSLAESKIRTAQNTFNHLESEIGSLVSMYNLANNKPGIEFYEGIDGIKKVLEDTLKSKTEICLFLNRDALQKEEMFHEINEKYKVRRERAGVKKKIIRAGAKSLGDEEQKKEYQEITEIRYFEKNISPFKSSIQIYDNKISYQIIENGQVVSIIIEDRNIYEMNKAWFEYMWENSER
ncbi:MAG: Transcriptional regulator, TrmB [uncultured bacterium]|nr:MAG: Transcriptional regulator, TrmB [uncultured bacterium]KKP68897.1 MAG: Transcriptional regulator, TrmB [Candidatus Moranbacteria bacterium GW2011_GWE1_35_17]KKP72507.1 MAG: Transcriptional regulator, TrmB [Candidatus Moranbacteria bacterium GW2011_GWE2_35_164]KKP81755.1 MAG: Transcriptional regulator, TrmB [Candidatus Moranbacteria bacterium GW2011_GWF1_35_5]KKP84216.1 MAG: Transcriptional regulator, TrmB [Candidatus Moranbacteria bacterium GW2011_GWF2_35_54]